MSGLPSAGRFPSALVATLAADGTPGCRSAWHGCRLALGSRLFLLALGQAFAFGRRLAVALQTRL